MGTGFAGGLARVVAISKSRFLSASATARNPRMIREQIAPAAHVRKLALDLNRMHGTRDFTDCASMGELTAEHISLMLGV
jgi:hypothetical protein